MRKTSHDLTPRSDRKDVNYVLCPRNSPEKLYRRSRCRYRNYLRNLRPINFPIVEEKIAKLGYEGWSKPFCYPRVVAGRTQYWIA